MELIIIVLIIFFSGILNGLFSGTIKKSNKQKDVKNKK
jgi:hypothetical protein